MLRTHTCGQLTKAENGKEVQLAGWVNTRRDHGGVIFIDLRDRYGFTQITFNPDSKEVFEIADKLRREYVISVKGKVRKRPEGMENPNISTGEIEVIVSEITILNKAETPPFEIDSRTEISEDLRLKYRFLDLRRPRLQQNLVFRAKVIKFIRDWMFSKGFTEIETPILTVSSPEGARDFLVPSRVHPGKFYALPQAPQQYKQLLMVAGMDRYFQIAPCMRDEDARADRSPGEFYQLDIETSFLTQNEFFELMEPLFYDLTETFTDKKVMQKPLPRITYREAMLKYGSDKPDLRFGVEIKDLSRLLKGCKFSIFANTINDGGVVRAICAPAADMTRKELDALEEFVKGYGAKGLAYITIKEGEIKSPLTKFLGEDAVNNVIKEMKAKKGDIIFFAADKEKTVCSILGALRLKLGKDLGLIDESILAWAWVVDFPMYEYDEEKEKVEFSHNPFSMPQGEIEALETKDPLDILAYQYDIICNGIEVSSGAVRNHRPDIMYKAFEIAGYGPDVVNKKFGHMIAAFKYGAPPHCGFAPGIERMVMILRGEQNIREITAFPKNKSAEDAMMGAPSEVDEEQLKDLHIQLDQVARKNLEQKKQQPKEK